ncbi:MAG: hypothetical protein LBU14_05440 [Candidatus Peribacteria bacterium]|jgi:hypothetical protein|nr:hypothetical protein [Candidatus Peribacteria bacterium]
MSKLTQNIETLEEASKITKKEMPENTFFDTKALATNKEFEEILDTKKVEILIT